MGARIQSLMVRLRLPRIEFERPGHTQREYSAVTTFYLIVVPALLLIAIGLMMAFSSQAVMNIASEKDPYKAFLKPAMLVLAALVAMGIVQLFRPHWWRTLAWVAFLGSLVAQTLVLSPLGASEGGNTNWIRIPGLPFLLQPSEILKLGIILFLAWVLSRPGTRLKDPAQIMVLAGVPIGLALLAVMLGRDLGTAMVMALACVGALWVADLPKKWFAVLFAALIPVSVLLVLSNPTRIKRVMEILPWAKPERSLSAPTQIDHAMWAFGTGGLFGVGPGASREKWNYLQEADTDFILAIIGEEFGFFGSTVVLLCIGLLLWGLLRLCAHTPQLFDRVVVGGVATWIGVQALINITSVSNIGPVIGVPLPFVSSGGSSLLFTSIALGVVLSIARNDAGMRQVGRPDEASAGRDPRVARPRRSATAVKFV